MANVVVPQAKEKKDPLDTPMKVLSIAGAVSGMKKDMAETDAIERRKKLLEEQNQSQTGGVV